MDDYNYSQFEDNILYEEAYEHLKNILTFFEIEFTPQDTATAECQLTFGLVILKTGNITASLEFL